VHRRKVSWNMRTKPASACSMHRRMTSLGDSFMQVDWWYFSPFCDRTGKISTDAVPRVGARWTTARMTLRQRGSEVA